MPRSQKPRRKYRRRNEQRPDIISTPKCATCGKDTFVRRTSPGGVFYGCDLSHEVFLQLEKLAPVLQQRYAKDLSDMPEAHRREFAKAADQNVRSLKDAMGTIQYMHRPLAELD